MKHRYVVLAFLGLIAGVVWTFAARTAHAQENRGLTLSATSLTFKATINGSPPPAQTLTVSASRSTTFTARASVQSDGRNWLTVSPTGSLTTNRTLTVSANPSGLSTGTYNGTISIVSNGTTHTVSVSLVVSAATVAV
ncbi:MAG TPA: hypothetical protein VN893_08770, partial [Bryobacteraceae bacterium]|nr:hypothetical protein [Bryobacteraceae bacterium]